MHHLYKPLERVLQKVKKNKNIRPNIDYVKIKINIISFVLPFSEFKNT